MGSQLEDALRAAAAAAAAKTTATTAAAATATATVKAAASPVRRNANRRQRRRSRSDSLASESAAGDAADPAQRIAAFRERMFDVGKDTASARFAAPGGDELGVKVQWKPKKPAARTAGGGGDEEDAVPQLTRARVVAKPVETSSAAPTTAAANKKHKKRNKNKNAAAPVVHELQVPSPPAPIPMPAPVANKKQPPARAQATRVVPAAKARDDDALEFSDPGDEDDEDVHDTKNATTATATVKKAPVAAPKAALPAKPAASQRSVATAPTGQSVKPALNGVQANGAVTKPVAKPAAKPAPKPASKPAAKQAQPKPSATAVSKADRDHHHDSDDDDDKWDLDALVKRTVHKATQRPPRKPSVSDGNDDDDDDDGGGDESDADKFTGKKFRQHQLHLFSQLIDEAARERWELVEVGRLVRIFAAQWGHKKKKTARFLRRCCPELVSVDFLEGLNIPLTATQLLKIFARGSGTPVVLMNKIASAVENGNLSVRDEDLQSFVVEQTQPMATNREVVEFLLPLLESLSKVKDVGVLLKAVCAHWHVERTAALVQDILLTPVFDDLDGQPDEILEDLPALEGRLDFPSCMDDEDADENGNLEGLIAGEDSDLGESDEHPDDAAEEELGEILSDDAEGEDSHAEDEVYEGETDSEEEREAQERLNPTKRRRSRFVLDEADEDEEDEDEEDGFIDDDDDDDSDDDSGDSSDEDAPKKPQRKRLRQK